MAKKKPAAKVKRAVRGAQTSTREMAGLGTSPPTTSTNPSDLQSMIAVLRDKEKPVDARFAALQLLGAARFASRDFPSIEGDYIAALREVSTDADGEMRRRALGILAREKDGFALKRLLEGLKKPETALLPPEKALQLLGSEIHGEAYSVARDIVKDPPNPTARREALRLLAADASSAPLFEEILQDKNESPELRQISAAALHTLKPERLQEYAREILLDPSEHDDLRQTSLTALTQFGSPDLGGDKQLMKRVNRMSATGGDEVKSSARQFLGKYNG